MENYQKDISLKFLASKCWYRFEFSLLDKFPAWWYQTKWTFQMTLNFNQFRHSVLKMKRGKIHSGLRRYSQNTMIVCFQSIKTDFNSHLCPSHDLDLHKFYTSVCKPLEMNKNWRSETSLNLYNTDYSYQFLFKLWLR